MKNFIVLNILILFSTGIFSQSKLVVTHKKNAKSTYFETNQNVKIFTNEQKTFEGTLKILNGSLISINDVNINLSNLRSIKLLKTSKKIPFRNIVLATGLVAVSTSSVLAITSNESAVSVFAGGAATTIIGGLIQNKNKLYSDQKYTFTIQ